MDFLYAPFYFLGFYTLKSRLATLCEQWLPRTPVYMVAQNALSTVTAASIVCMKHLYDKCATDVCRTMLFKHGTAVCFSYYIYDTCVILLYDYKRQWPFLIHHAIALALGYGIKTFAFSSMDASVNYIACIEFSNLFHGTWDTLRRNRCEDAIIPFHTATYISMRTVGLSLVSYELWRHTQRNPAAYGSLITFVLFISYYFSYKLYRKYYS